MCCYGDCKVLLVVAMLLLWHCYGACYGVTIVFAMVLLWCC